MHVRPSRPTRRASRLLLVLALVAALVPVAMPGTAVAASSTYYVDAITGSNTAAGISAAPFKTITHAMAGAAAGDTIVWCATERTTPRSGSRSRSP